MEQVKKTLQKAIKDVRDTNNISKYALKVTMGSKAIQIGEFNIVTSHITPERMNLINELTKDFGVFKELKYVDSMFIMTYKVCDMTTLNLLKQLKTVTYKKVVGWKGSDMNPKPVYETLTKQIEVYAINDNIVSTPENPTRRIIEHGEYAGCTEVCYGDIY